MKYNNILITGADGFIGSHLIWTLFKETKDSNSIFYKANIRALSLYNSFNTWGWLEELNCINYIEVVSGDIRDPYFCNNVTKNIDIIFHLAALISIPYSYVTPDSYIDTNVKGTLNICQAALNNNVSRVLHTSTSEVYGSAKYVPIDENHPLQPQSPYSASKIGADAIAMSFYYSFNLPITIARPFNTYGPRQSARAVIPTIITQISSGLKEIKLGDTAPTRDFNYVEDTCNGLILIAKNFNTIGEVINIGSNYEISIYELFNLIKNIMDAEVKLVSDNKRIRPKNSEVLRLWCDNTKIQYLTNFKPKYTIELGLQKTIEWFTQSKNKAKYKSNFYNI